MSEESKLEELKEYLAMDDIHLSDDNDKEKEGGTTHENDDNQSKTDEPDEEHEAQTDDNQEGDEESSLTASEKKAIELGWKPKEEYVAGGGDPDRWRSASDYVLFDDLHKQNSALKERLDKNEQLADQRVKNLAKILKYQYESRKNDLEAAIKNARDQFDPDEALRLKDELDQLNAANKDVIYDEPKKDHVDHEVQHMMNLVQAWEQKNPWINDAESQKAIYAKGYFRTLQETHPYMSMEEALQKIDKAVTQFDQSQKKVNPRRTVSTPTESAGKTVQKSSKDKKMTFEQLPREWRHNWDKGLDDVYDYDQSAYVQVYLDSEGA